MTEIGETVDRVDSLIKDTKRFQKLCDIDIERAEEVVSIGMPNCRCHFNVNRLLIIDIDFVFALFTWKANI